MHDLSHYKNMNMFHKDNEVNRMMWIAVLSALITIGTCVYAIADKDNNQDYEQTQADYDDTIMYY